jgi:polyhydroxyalkanoate synthase subunit PhaE
LNEQAKSFMTNWWETQEKMFGYWKDTWSQFQPDKAVGMFDKQFEMFASMKEWGQNADLAKFYQDWLQKTVGGLQDFTKMASPGIGADTMEKMMQAGEVYTKLFSFWTDLAKNMPGQLQADKWQEFSASMMQDYNKVLESFFAANLPESVKMLMKSPTEIGEMYQQTMYNLFLPWVDSSERLKESYLKALKGDRQAYMDFTNAWYESFQGSYGKLLHMPAFGLSRESIEKVMHGVETLTQFVSTSNKFNAALYKVGYEAMEKLMQNLTVLTEKGKAPDSFKEFYKLWWQTNEEAYFNLFKAESFARMMGEVLDAGTKFKKQYDEMLMEIISSNLPIPTDKDMDSLVKTVYQLKKNLREQGKKIDDLYEKLEKMSDKGGAVE